MTDEQPEVAHGLFGPGIFGSGVDLSPLDEDTAYRLGVLVGQMITSAVEADRLKRPQEEKFVTRSQLLHWDWKEDVPLADIGRAVEEMSDDQVHIYDVDTGSDHVAVIVTNGVLNTTQVQEIYRDWEDTWR